MDRNVGPDEGREEMRDGAVAEPRLKGVEKHFTEGERAKERGFGKEKDITNGVDLAPQQ